MGPYLFPAESDSTHRRFSTAKHAEVGNLAKNLLRTPPKFL